MGAGELAAEKFDEAARARAAVGAEQAHAIEKDQQLENFGVLEGAERGLGLRLLGLGQKGRKGVVEATLDGWNGRSFIDNAGSERFVRISQRLQGGEDVGISGAGLRGAEFGDGEGDGGEKLRVDADEIRGEADVEQRRVGGKLARVLLFVAMRGDQVGAVGRAVEGDFAFGAATDGADGFGFGRAEPAGFTFLTDRTRQENPPE